MSHRPDGFTAVMAQRAPLNPDDLDYFPTPPWAARAGGELIRRFDPEARTCWEPASGGGHMAWGLLDYFDGVSVSDIHDHGGDLGARSLIGDFLDPGFGTGIDADWIVTNPPFVKGEAFVRTAWARARRGVAMLLRLQFLEGAARYRLFAELPLHACAPFAERVPMVKGRWDPAASSATAYAWFVWLKPGTPGFGRGPALSFIAPGTKARLTRADDAARFGVAAVDARQGELLPQ